MLSVSGTATLDGPLLSPQKSPLSSPTHTQASPGGGHEHRPVGKRASMLSSSGAPDLDGPQVSPQQHKILQSQIQALTRCHSMGGGLSGPSGRSRRASALGLPASSEQLIKSRQAHAHGPLLGSSIGSSDRTLSRRASMMCTPTSSAPTSSEHERTNTLELLASAGMYRSAPSHYAAAAAAGNGQVVLPWGAG